MDSTAKNSYIENAILVANKLISDLCKISTDTISKKEYDKLQRKYIRLEIQEKGFKIKKWRRIGYDYQSHYTLQPHQETNLCQ